MHHNTDIDMLKIKKENQNQFYHFNVHCISYNQLDIYICFHCVPYDVYVRFSYRKISWNRFDTQTFGQPLCEYVFLKFQIELVYFKVEKKQAKYKIRK